MISGRNVFSAKACILSSLLFGISGGSAYGVSLMEAIQNATIEGFGFGRIITIHGRDGEGERYQFRLKATLTTGEIAGWSASAGILYSKGSSTPDGNNTDKEIVSSRADKFTSASDAFNIANFYITWNTKEQLGSNTRIRVGQQSPNTPFNDVNLDRAIGVFVDNKDIKGVNIGFQWWDSWISDDIYISRAPYSLTTTANGSGIGNSLFMIYVSSSSDFAKDTGFTYRLYYAYAHRLIDYMIFADTSYKLNMNGAGSITVLLQTALAGLRPDMYLYGDTILQNITYQGMSTGAFAKNRGMYNIRADYRYDLGVDEGTNKPVSSLVLSAGFAGSYGDGYGTLIDNTGGLKIGGQLWNSFSGSEANGFGLFGAGTFKNSWIILPYLKAEWTYGKFGVALDVAYVRASHFYFLKKAASRVSNLNTIDKLYNETQSTATNKIATASAFEISPSVTYKITSNINVAAYYALLMGTPTFGRFRFQMNYVF